MLKTEVIAKRPINELLGNIEKLYGRYDLSGEWNEDYLVEKLLAIDILKLLPDEIIRFGIRVVFGDGKYNKQQARRVNLFRQSDRAKILYQLWQGKEYKPESHLVTALSPRCTIHYIEV